MKPLLRLGSLLDLLLSLTYASPSLEGLCSKDGLDSSFLGILSFIGKISVENVASLNSDSVSINLVHFRFNNKKFVGYAVLCIPNEHTVSGFGLNFIFFR